MFGYIRVNKPELKMGEYDLYKGVYCTLCKQLGKRYGFVARMSLSYDFTFIALLQMALQSDCGGFQKGRCVYNPLKKCLYCSATGAVDAAADIAMLLLYYKLLDNVQDSRGLWRLGAKILCTLEHRAHKKAAARCPEQEQAVAAYMRAQQALEAANTASLDAACEPTANLTAYLLAAVATGESEKRVCERLGYCLGRFIYLADAADDLEKDRERGNYNPLLLQTDGGESAMERARASLNLSQAQAVAAYNLLTVRRYDGILRNILEQGLPSVMKQLGRKEKDHARPV